MNLVHHHLLYYAKVGEKKTKKQLNSMFADLLIHLNMKCLIPPKLKFSYQKAWTGIMGIITSHISFHYWTIEQYVQVDIYSCKKFDKIKAIKFLNSFWRANNNKAIFIDREKGFKIVQY